jgi:8-amino-7-oxononanoate synthase
MDGTFAPLLEIVEGLEEVFPKGNGYLIVDEAHATGIYGPQGRGLVARLGLENRVLARLHTFGKALAGTGGVFLLSGEEFVLMDLTAVILTNTIIRDYLLNYARSLIYTTSLSYANIISAECSFDMLENGVAQEVTTHHLLQMSLI